ncbi:MAG TPA: energy transducer TonB [Terriglobia bacterium]|nr:energy transducer TonB [Terriglobia bacterium]
MRNRKSLILVALVAGVCLQVATLQGAETRKAKKMTQPKYPEIALKMHVEGTVKVEAVVGADGKVNNVIVVSGNPLLKSTAVDCVKQWEYEPGKDTALVSIDISFKLPN